MKHANQENTEFVARAVNTPHFSPELDTPSAKRDIILAGVGGQGILTIAYILDMAALQGDLKFRQAEVHGMAQRGGAVQSHLRISKDQIYSDLIPQGECDLVISIEPMEALRYVTYLKPSGSIISSCRAVENISNYPAIDEVLRAVAETGEHVLIDARSIAQRAGNRRTENIAVLGASGDDLPFDEDELRELIRGLMSKKSKRIADQNISAFDMGLQAAREYRHAISQGLEPLAALEASTKATLS